MLTLLVLIPLIAAALIRIARRRSAIEAIHLAACSASFIVAALIGLAVWTSGTAVGLWGFLRTDELSLFMVAIITSIGTVSGICAIGYIRAEFGADHLHRVRLFYALFQ